MYTQQHYPRGIPQELPPQRGVTPYPPSRNPDIPKKGVTPRGKPSGSLTWAFSGNCAPPDLAKIFQEPATRLPKIQRADGHILSSPRPRRLHGRHPTPRLTPPPPVRAFSTHRPARSRSWPPFLRPLALWRARYQPAQPATSIPTCMLEWPRRLRTDSALPHLQVFTGCPYVRTCVCALAARSRHEQAQRVGAARHNPHRHY